MGEKIRKLSRYVTILFCIHHIKSRWSYGIGSKNIGPLFPGYHSPGNTFFRQQSDVMHAVANKLINHNYVRSRRSWYWWHQIRRIFCRLSNWNLNGSTAARALAALSLNRNRNANRFCALGAFEAKCFWRVSASHLDLFVVTMAGRRNVQIMSRKCGAFKTHNCHSLGRHSV